MKKFWVFLWNFVKKWAWYSILLIASSVYLWHYRFDLFTSDELNAPSLIFILWILLLAFPLVSEMELLGVKIKKEVEKATGDVKSSLSTLQTQISQIQMSNSIANTITLNNSPLPSVQKLEEDLQKIIAMNPAYSGAKDSVNNHNSTVGETNVYLFKVRLDIETLLRELCERTGSGEKMSIPQMVNVLRRAEIIDGMTCDMIFQIIKIANRGVHGETVSEEYVSFVNKTYPEIIRQLNEASIRIRNMSWGEF